LVIVKNLAATCGDRLALARLRSFGSFDAENARVEIIHFSSIQIVSCSNENPPKGEGVRE
jgi:hypothetical protein